MQNLYTITVPVFIKSLGGLKNILTKAEAYAKEKGMDDAALLDDRLASDMYPLKKQVQIASDNAKAAASRLSGKEIPKYEDTEASFAELYARIDKTVEYLKTFSPEDFKDAEERKITLPYFKNQYITGTEYALEQVVPNFLFHVVTAYGIVRKNGVPLSKSDYINGLPLKDL